jgi:hypothetical protein
METAFVLMIFKDLVQAAFQFIHRYTPSAGFEISFTTTDSAIKDL